MKLEKKGPKKDSYLKMLQERMPSRKIFKTKTTEKLPISDEAITRVLFPGQKSPIPYTA